MTLVKGAACVLVVGGVAVQFVRPARTNPVTDPARTLFASTHVPGATRAALERGCRDCHSNDTRWPWYSNVAPVSWFVIEHVNHGRSHFNYSEWAGYDREEAARLVKGSCDLVRKREMPLASYLWMHSDARPTTAEVDALCSWTPR